MSARKAYHKTSSSWANHPGTLPFITVNPVSQFPSLCLDIGVKYQAYLQTFFTLRGRRMTCAVFYRQLYY